MKHEAIDQLERLLFHIDGMIKAQNLNAQSINLADFTLLTITAINAVASQFNRKVPTLKQNFKNIINATDINAFYLWAYTVFYTRKLRTMDLAPLSYYQSAAKNMNLSSINIKVI